MSEVIKVLITQQDRKSPFQSTGCLVWETPTGISDTELDRRAEQLKKNGYGRVWIGEIKTSDLKEVGI